MVSTAATEQRSESLVADQHDAVQQAPTSDGTAALELVGHLPHSADRQEQSAGDMPLPQGSDTLSGLQDDASTAGLSLPSPQDPASPRASFHTAHYSLLDVTEYVGRDDEEGAADTSAPQVADWMDETDAGANAESVQLSNGLTQKGSADMQRLSTRLQHLATPSSSPQLRPRPAGLALGPEAARGSSAHTRGSVLQASTSPMSSRARPGSRSSRRTRRLSSRRARVSQDDGHSKSSKRFLVADVHLPDEDASTFQDVLCHIYPHLQLLVTWYNIGALMRFDDKYQIPFLRRSCISFLRAALAGRPIEAMALGERHGLEAEYKEASRHVLDNMPSWSPKELDVLSKETLLKLERKRIWFLERILKLSLANPTRDYECHAACPDPKACAKSLGERWQAAYQASTRYGPPQPSVVWRQLRELEGTGGQPVAACHRASQAWVQLLFDRMFSITVGLSGTRPQPKFLSIKLLEGASR